MDAGTAPIVVTIGSILIALLGGRLLREGFPQRLGTGDSRLGGTPRPCE